MAKISTYLNFMGQTEAAFEFYRTVFGTEFERPIMRMSDAPPWPGMPEMSAAEKAMVMHVALPILGGHLLMGSDAIASMGHSLNAGNNVHLNLEPDSREEADRLFAALSDGGKVTMPMQDMFWGAYYGSFTDKFGVQWMVNYTAR